MIVPKNTPNTLVTSSNNSLDAFRAARASGEILTIRKAARWVNLPYRTFNYHLHLGHIPTVPTSASRTYFVTRVDAERFARRLKVWRNQNETFDWFVDEPSETSAAPHLLENTDDITDTEDTVDSPHAVAACA